MQRRHLVLGVALVLTLGASVWLAASEEPEASVSTPRSPAGAAAGAKGRAAPNRATRPTTTEEQLIIPGAEALRRENLDMAASNLFTTRDWQPPPKPAPPPPVVVPKAPPLPFRFLGQLQDGQQTVVFLGAGTRTLMVRAGDTLDGQYQVESVNLGKIVFIYQPLNERQSLPTGKSQ